MSPLGGLDGFEVSLLGKVGIRAVSRQVRGAGFSCGRVKFLSEEGKQRGPPGLRAVGRVFRGGMGSKKGGKTCEVSVKPGF